MSKTANEYVHSSFDDFLDRLSLSAALQNPPLCYNHERRQKKEQGGSCTSCPCPCPLRLPPTAAPRRIFHVDKVSSGYHTHVKVWLIERHFCKTTQTSVTFCVFKFKFLASTERPKAKSVSASGGAKPLCPPDQGLCPGRRYVFFAHSNMVDIVLHKNYCPPLIVAPASDS